MQADKVCYTFDQSTRTCPPGVVLETMNNLVGEYAHDFILCSVSIALYPVKGHVDFLVGI